MFNHERVMRAFLRWKWAVGMRQITRRPPPPPGPVAFAVMRNEALRLPAYLAHYRRLGVVRFVILENQSNDRTRKELSEQEDVELYSSLGHFIGKAFWIDHLLKKHGVGRWCVVADADELLVYPGWPETSLPKLTEYLDATSSNAVHAILLDLYPDGPLSRADYRRGDDYFRREWFFDAFESLTTRPRHFQFGMGLDYRFFGGVRQRLFGIGVCCSKFPLLRYEVGMYLNDGHHYLERGRFAELRAVVCHFKYLQDFDAHAREEVSRGQHIGAGAEYQAYAETLAKKGDEFSLCGRESIGFEGTRQLEELGFLVRPQSFDEYFAKGGSA